MSRIIKVIDNETIEIADYRNPEVIFKSSQNPPTLQDTKNEIEHLEWYCTFKDTINPFQVYEENKRLNNIINELEEELERESNMKEEDTCLEHNTFIDIKNTLKTVLKRLQELKGSNSNE